MTVGVCTLELHLPESDSLKSKRRVLKSLKDRVQRRFNVSIAEVEAGDAWQRSVIGVACVANERRHVNEVLDRVVRAVKETPAVRMVDYRVELL